MTTHFIIKRTDCNDMLRAGAQPDLRFPYLTNSLFSAKKFTTEWCANNMLQKLPDKEYYKVIKVCHQ